MPISSAWRAGISLAGARLSWQKNEGCVKCKKVSFISCWPVQGESLAGRLAFPALQEAPPSLQEILPALWMSGKPLLFNGRLCRSIVSLPDQLLDTFFYKARSQIMERSFIGHSRANTA